VFRHQKPPPPPAPPRERPGTVTCRRPGPNTRSSRAHQAAARPEYSDPVTGSLHSESAASRHRAGRPTGRPRTRPASSPTPHTRLCLSLSPSHCSARRAAHLMTGPARATKAMRPGPRPGPAGPAERLGKSVSFALRVLLGGIGGHQKMAPRPAGRPAQRGSTSGDSESGTGLDPSRYPTGPGPRTRPYQPTPTQDPPIPIFRQRRVTSPP
jgi:hypothetical protein